LKKVINIKKLSEIVDQYEIFIIDQWGVIHDGIKGYSFAIECIKKLLLLNKKLIIISNSSKRKQQTVERLPKLGFKKNSFAEVMTSGEIVWQNLYKKKNKLFKDLGNNCYHLSDKTSKDSLKFIDGLNYNFIQNIEEADFILGCTTIPGYKVLDYVPILEKAIEKKIPFICANPDYETVESTSKNLIICMGTVAELYKDIGGEVHIMGKPSIEIYKKSMKRFQDFSKKKILAIGDSIHHDIKGAKNFGIDSLLITSGIHKSIFDQHNPFWDEHITYLSKFNFKPTYLSSKLQF
tara:strand:+ start:1128 stop:2006 length:879 start_codon:yes stop_codon:yes gene_type:complete